MKSSKTLNTILIVSGLIASGIGTTILFAPVSFYASYGIDLGGKISLLNEIRAPGGALLAIGLLIMSGAFINKLSFTAILVSSLLYLSYGLSRIVSIALDGIPVELLVQATALEIIIGLICVFALVKYQKKRKEITS